MHSEVNLSLLKSKLSNGEPTIEKQYTFVASLQLNGDHICSSGLFQKDFLLTTGNCAIVLLNGMTKKNKTGTAVIGDSSLKKGQRVIILNVAYSKNDAFIGVVMVSSLEGFSFVIKIKIFFSKLLSVSTLKKMLGLLNISSPCIRPHFIPLCSRSKVVYLFKNFDPCFRFRNLLIIRIYKFLIYILNELTYEKQDQ